MAPEILARFWALIQKPDDPHGCWIWTGYVNTPGRSKSRSGRNRYPRPRFRLSSGTRTPDGKVCGQLHVYAHRLTLALATGKTLAEMAGLEACHICANPDHRCVNLYHLYWDTPEEHRETHQAERFGTFI